MASSLFKRFSCYFLISFSYSPTDSLNFLQSSLVLASVSLSFFEFEEYYPLSLYSLRASYYFSLIIQSPSCSILISAICFFKQSSSSSFWITLLKKQINHLHTINQEKSNGFLGFFVLFTCCCRTRFITDFLHGRCLLSIYLSRPFALPHAACDLLDQKRKNI